MFVNSHLEILKTSYKGKKRNIFLKMSQYIGTKLPR